MSFSMVYDTLQVAKEHMLLVAIIGVFLIHLLRLLAPPTIKNVPTVRYSNWLPDFVNRILYYPYAISMIEAGYYKYKDRMFRMITSDGEVYVLPMKYQKDLRHLNLSKISSLDAQYENALGDYTHILLNTTLVSDTIRKRLTPSLSRLVPRVIDELVRAFSTVLPETEKNEWITINPNDLFNRLIGLSSARVMVGDALRHNEEWLKASVGYAHCLGITMVVLRPIPKYLRPLVAPFLPSTWEMSRSVRLAKRLFSPIVNERRRAAEEIDPGYTKPDDFLQWFLDLGVEEGEILPAAEISQHMLLLVALAVTHTSTMALCHATFDLISRPEYLEPLREEIHRTLPDGWHLGTQAAFLDQVRLDSFLRESQRFAPPGDLSFHRKVMSPVTLHDGVVLPKGVHICFPAGAISRDPTFVQNPLAFDGFRWCKDPKDRYALSPELAKSALIDQTDNKEDSAPNAPSGFVTVTATNMGFGYGRQTCPGRFFAANTTKTILSRLILDYDFRFAGGKDAKRPSNTCIGEHILPNLTAELEFQKKHMEF
ncbi:hypothetical protein N7452_004029 [Penicillium brevicompactum]|uniref:Uncharacterized protein n=1 Tax=Penicillium brevicompactum TaxID=5074 RepID=A0A9W9QUN6_PENBR|nr:hypothetical protein N7452_004029 [Penicillium brevicompactum]